MPKVVKKKSAKKVPPKKGASQKKPAPTTPATTVAEGREVVYDKITVKLLIGDKALTAAQAKELIGWESEDDATERAASKLADASKMKPVKFGDAYVLKDNYDKKVKLWNNPKNRVFDMATAKTWESEILNPGVDGQGQPTRTRWRVNGETLIIGRTGITISAQHRLCGLILAAQEWALHPDRWPNWDAEPTLDCIIVFGIDEADNVVNTIDTGKPRSLTDVIYRSELFADVEDSDREKAAGILAYACKRLGNRVGSWVGSFAPKRTHTESIEYIQRHLRLLDAVKHIQEENGKKGAINKYLPTGNSAAMLYLMGCCASDPTEYRNADPPNESFLDWEQWELAMEFFVDLAQGGKKFNALREVLDQYREGEAEPSIYERLALIAKCWNLYVQGKKLTTDGLKLDYKEDDNGNKVLDECPTVGGIDAGGSSDTKSEDGEVSAGDEPDPLSNDPSESEIAERASQERVKRTPKNDTKAKVTSADIEQLVWVREDNGGHWRGTLKEIYDAPLGKVARIQVAKGFAGAGKVLEAPLDRLQHDEPPTDD